MWKYYNANPLNLNSDDCTIRALSCATGKSWDYVYEHLSDVAQAEGTMMDNAKFIVKYLDKRYKRIPTIDGTVRDVSNYFKDNVVLITMKGHITCSKYGIVYDSFDCLNRQVEYVWIVS